MNEKKLRKIRELEEEILSASPRKAAKLLQKLIKLKIPNRE